MSEDCFDLAPDIGEIPRLLDWVETCCGKAAVGGDTCCKLSLALEEAVANVINYGFSKTPPPHRIKILLAIDADRVSAQVIDNGQPFDPSAAQGPERNLPLERRDPGGLGICLIHSMMDRVDYDRVCGENRLRLERLRKCA
jgi:anti-sigma regulatory factor (Ser/Thr protein kinase)